MRLPKHKKFNHLGKKSLLAKDAASRFVIRHTTKIMSPSLSPLKFHESESQGHESESLKSGLESGHCQFRRKPFLFFGFGISLLVCIFLLVAGLAQNFSQRLC